MSASATVEPRGSQYPRLSSIPPHVSTAGDDAIELAASAGLHLDEWQQLVLREAMGERADGKWAAFEVSLIVPRQNGKGSVLEALELYWLFLADPDAPPPLILHSAHEFKTSAEHFRRMRELIQNAPHLHEQVLIIRTAAGSEAIELKNGSRLRFVTRTGGSGRGFSADLIVVDEAYNLTPDSMGAVIPTLAARPNPQVWYTSSAGMEASEQLARIRERGVSGRDMQLAFFEWSADPESDLGSLDAIYQSNPAVGIRIPLEFVLLEQSTLPEEHYNRERLGIWTTAAGDEVIPSKLWMELADPDSSPLDPIVIAFAVTPMQDAASISIAGRRSDGLAHVETIDARSGTGWVVPRLSELAARWNPSAIVLDATGPAGSLLPAIAEFDPKTNEMIQKASVSDYAQACGAFYDAAQNRLLRHRPDPTLDAAVVAGRKRPLAERWAWGRKGLSDITPLESATLALWALPAHHTYDLLQSVF